MPLFMDVHNTIPAGADAAAVADAHAADQRIQDKYDTRYLNYWFDADHRKIFCLVEAPDEAAARSVHKEAHGLIADEIYAVEQG